MKIQNDFKQFILPKKPIEKIMFLLSFIFIILTIILILIICRLKGFHFCLKIKKILFYQIQFSLNKSHPISSSSSIPPSISTSTKLPVNLFLFLF